MDFLKVIAQEQLSRANQPRNPTQGAPGSGGLMYKLGDVLGNQEKQDPHRLEGNTGNSTAGMLIGKLGEALASQQGTQQTQQQHGGDSLVGKIGGVLGGHQTQGQHHAEGNAGNGTAGMLMGMLGEALADQQKTQQQQQHGGSDSFVGKIGGVLGGHQQNSTQQQHGSGGLTSIVNNALGGGQAGKQKEDGLDKAIDWVQEHVLHQGPQDNESVFEKMKDKAIANAVRSQFKHATGHEFPI